MKVQALTLLLLASLHASICEKMEITSGHKARRAKKSSKSSSSKSSKSSKSRSSESSSSESSSSESSSSESSKSSKSSVSEPSSSESSSSDSSESSDNMFMQLDEMAETESTFDARGEGPMFANVNPCAGKKPTDDFFKDKACMMDGIVQVMEQSGTDVSVGYKGNLESIVEPQLEPFWTQGLCPVNVHFHVGTEHRSEGEYDEDGSGPDEVGTEERLGFQCRHYDESDPKFTTPYDWKYCSNMVVGQTYEIHWPHSAAGACGTPNQYQTSFYDGVFCVDGILSLDPLNTHLKAGVQAQVFTVVNDEDYYYPHLIKGMIIDDDKGTEVTKYTGSTTGTSRNNEVCSMYSPVTWHVDRKCHMISASSFDKMCADMRSQRDDMSSETEPEGARELVMDDIASNNHVNRKRLLRYA